MNRLVIVLIFLISSLVSQAQAVDVVVQTGHSSSVNGVAFSPDGNYIASACDDGSIKIWDAKLGFEIFTFYGFARNALDVAFSPNGKFLLGTGAVENAIWDIQTGRQLALIYSGDMQDAERDAELSRGIFSYDGNYCYGSREDFSIMRWDLAEVLHPEKYTYPYGQIPYTTDSLLELNPPASALFFSGHTAAITGLAVTRDNKFLVSSSNDSTIIVWDAKTGVRIRTIKNNFEVEHLALTPDGKRIISCDDDMSDKAGFRIWDLATGKQLHYQPLPSKRINHLDVSSDGRYFSCGNLNGTIELYNLSNFKLVRSIKAHESWVNSLAFSRDGRRLVSGSHDNNVRIWNPANGQLLRDFRKTIANIDHLVYENNHRLLTTTSNTVHDQHTITWELDHGIGIRNQYLTRSQLRNDEFISMDTAGKKLLITEDSAFHLFDPVTGKKLNRFEITRPGSAAISPGGDYIFFQSRTDSFFTLQTSTGHIDFFAAHPDTDTSRLFRRVNAIDFSNDGNWIAAGGAEADVYIWNARTREYVRNLNYLDEDSAERKTGMYYENGYLTVSNSAIYDLKFSPNGKLIAAAVHYPDPIVTGGLIIVWDVATGKMLHWESAHIYPIQSINWSPDGEYLVTGSNDKWVKVWRYADFDQQDPEPVFAYMHDFTAMHTSITRDNKWLISAGIDGKIIIRDRNDFTPIATLIGLNGNDYVAITKNQYYTASKKGIQFIAFRQGNKVFPAGQFDLKFNRPDKVMEALGSTDTALIRSYRNAYYKRVRKLGIDTASFRDGFAVPAAEITNRDSIDYTQTQGEINLHIRAYDSAWQLDRFNLWVNEVPVFGQRGFSYRHLNRHSIDTIIRLKLSGGENRIEVSVINATGAESYREPLVVSYAPPKPLKERIIFAGIGIDRFREKEYNLQYSAKDIRDLALRLQQKYGTAITIDTLLNENVTIGNIKALKKRLLQTTENDKVIIAYSGHGLLNRNYDYFLSTYPVNFDSPEEGGLPYDELEDLLDSIPSRKKLLLIDACHSGEVDKDDLVRLEENTDSLVKGFKPVAYKKEENHLGLKNSFELMQSLFVNVGKSTGATIISAAAGTQFALERNDLKNGVFTYSILEAMDQYPTLTLSELKKIVGLRVEQLTRGLQKPTSRNETISVDWPVW